MCVLLDTHSVKVMQVTGDRPNSRISDRQTFLRFIDIPSPFLVWDLFRKSEKIYIEAYYKSKPKSMIKNWTSG